MSDGALDLTARFLDGYNAVDLHFRQALGAAGQEPRPAFRRLLVEYKTRHPWWPDDSALHLLADLRNVLVHAAAPEPLFVPTRAAVAQMDDVLARLRRPRTVGDTHCLCAVLVLSPDDTLGRVLALVRANDFSQFPIYGGGRFHGLLTENGVTRWLAYHNETRGAPSDFNGVLIRDLLALQEQSAAEAERGWANTEFAAPSSPVDGLAYRFSQNPALEAVLITPVGTPEEPPVGIVTRWDVLHLAAGQTVGQQT